MRFNLASLLAAMAITAALALSFLPLALTSHGALAVERGAAELARELQAARQRAVATELTYEVVFERTANAYYIKAAGATAPARRIQLPAGVNWVKLGANPIYFYKSGRCPTGGAFSLKHSHCGYQVEVIVATHSGRVRLERTEP